MNPILLQFSKDLCSIVMDIEGADSLAASRSPANPDPIRFSKH